MNMAKVLGCKIRTLIKIFNQNRVSKNAGRNLVWQQVTVGGMKGFEFLLPSDDRPNSWINRILGGGYEAGVFDELASLASEGGTLLDVGAHVGYFSCVWLRHGGKRVEAFEPLPQSREVIARVLAKNNLSCRAMVHPVALADFGGEGALLVNEKDLGWMSMAFLEGKGGVPRARRNVKNSLVVPVWKLDDYCESESISKCSVIKIDVEGAEDAVLDGGTRFIAKHRPIILCEIHNTDAAVMVSSRLAEWGYRPRPVRPEGGGAPVYRWDPQ